MRIFVITNTQTGNVVGTALFYDVARDMINGLVGEYKITETMAGVLNHGS
jgi:hypothetical protein